MKKTVYIVLIAIMALVIILTAVLLIFKLSGKPESGADASPSVSAGSIPSGTTMQPDEPASSASEATSPSASPSPSPSPTDEGLVIREEGPDGVSYTIREADSDLTYRLTMNEAVLEYVGDLDGHTFAALEYGNEYLKLRFIEGKTAAQLAPSFLNDIIAFTEFSQSGAETIDGTTITGEKIAASDGQTRVEAWLVDTEGGVLAVVISYTLAEEYTKSSQLYKIIATLEIKPEDAEDWAEVSPALGFG
jgi:hypothetical protein